MEERSVALDGPSGAGKSTLARMAAKRFGMIYVDTGALYRCVGLYILKKGVVPKDEESVTKLLREIDIEMSIDSSGVQRMRLNGEDVTDQIRSPESSLAASDVSAFLTVREFLFSKQRDMARKYDVIMDGRDITTVVLPAAGLKVFLTAKPELRAQRRYLELCEQNTAVTYDEVLSDLKRRDYNDSNRAVAPLRVADDAIVLDTSDMDLDESFNALCMIIKENLKK